MTASTAARPQWYLLPQSRRDTAPKLPSGAPLAARLVLGAYCALSAPIRADIRAGNNSRRVGIAFEQLDTRSIVPLRLSRRERGNGIDYLIKLEANTGGVL